MNSMPNLIGIAITPKILAPMEEIKSAEISIESGIKGDARGKKRNRQISILFEDDWADACSELGVVLPWLTRRANLFVSDMRAPQKSGQIITISNVQLEVKLETEPCDLMDKQRQGLQNALSRSWRGGVCCNVLKAGTISVGDKIAITT